MDDDTTSSFQIFVIIGADSLAANFRHLGERTGIVCTVCCQSVLGGVQDMRFCGHEKGAF